MTEEENAAHDQCLKKFGQKYDILKRPLHVGDYVVFCSGGGHSSSKMTIGKIFKWSSCQVQVEIFDKATLTQTKGVRSVDLAKVLAITEQMRINKTTYPEGYI